MKVRPRDIYVVLRVTALSLSRSQYILTMATPTPRHQISGPAEIVATQVSHGGIAHRRSLRPTPTSRSRHCF
jgi:hypothetical protein